MGQTALYDLNNNLSQQVSIPPDEAFGNPEADIDGTRKDFSAVEGPVQAICQSGAATGSPSAISVIFQLEEADDVGGTNNQVVATQKKVTLTADDTVGILQGITTKPFVRISIKAADSGLTGGTVPTLPVAATLLGQKKSF